MVPWPRIRRWAALAALAVVSIEHLRHGELVGSSAALAHLAGDAVLLIPLAAAALVAGAAVRARRDSYAGALAAASVFGFLTAVGSLVHSALDAASATTVAGHHGLIPGASRLSLGFVHAASDGGMAAPLMLAAAALTFAKPRRRRRVGLARGRAFARVAFAVTATVAATLPIRTVIAAAPFTSSLPMPQVLTESSIEIHAREADVPVLPGGTTHMWVYGTQDSNPANPPGSQVTVDVGGGQYFHGSFPGPTIRRPSGQTTNVTFVNDLVPNVNDSKNCASLIGAGLPANPCALTVHHHGEHAIATEDGAPASELIQPVVNGIPGSRTYRYDFTEGGPTTPEAPAFQWYHDHLMDVTGRNVWMGLAGMVIVDPAAGDHSQDDLPSGDYDVPLMLADRTFNATSHEMPYAFLPDGPTTNQLLVNGAAQPKLDVATHKYRLRLLNASNSRRMSLALEPSSDCQPADPTLVAFTQIGTESGLLPNPLTRTTINLGPAERAEIVVDFKDQLNNKLTLCNLSAPATGNTGRVMQFDVTTAVSDSSLISDPLRTIDRFNLTDLGTTRLWLLDQNQVDGTWEINGKGYDPARIDTEPNNPRLNDEERWVFVNTTPLSHLIHIHDVDWMMLARLSSDAYDPNDTKVEAAGLKETFLIRPNEVIVVASRFTDHTGTYVFHCHILEHEDNAMMAQFHVDA